MLLFIYYIFSLIFVQGCITYLAEERDTVSDAKFNAIIKYFGSVQDSILSLIQATTGGNDWFIFYDVVQTTGTTNAGLFLFFMGFFHIALLNVLTGIFVENAMELAKPDPFSQALEQQERDLTQAEELKIACNDLTSAKSSSIQPEDFERAINHGKLRAHLKVLGLDIKDARKFFTTITAASGQDELDIDMFVNGCMKLKGNASAIELQSLICEARQTAKDVHKLVRHNRNLLQSMNRGSEQRVDKDTFCSKDSTSSSIPPPRALRTQAEGESYSSSEQAVSSVSKGAHPFTWQDSRSRSSLLTSDHGSDPLSMSQSSVSDADHPGCEWRDSTMAVPHPGRPPMQSPRSSCSGRQSL